MAMPIIPCSDVLMGQAESLVRSVFRSMTPIERFSFVAIKHPGSVVGRLLMFLARIKDKVVFDVYVDETRTVLGTAEAGFDRIRLYTSTSPNEQAAQGLYERNGFREIGRKKGIFTTTIYREKRIGKAELTKGM